MIGIIAATVVIMLLWRRSHRPAPTDRSIAGDISALPTEHSTSNAARLPGWFGHTYAPARRIAGRVSRDGKPVKGAEVTLTSALTDFGVASPITLRTSSDGSFDFGVQPAASYQVVATYEATTPAIAQIALADPTARPPPDQLELRLTACVGAIFGRVIDASGNPIAHARVLRQGVAGGDTDDHGTYRLCTPRGDIGVRYSRDGYGSVFLTVTVEGETHQDVVLVPEGVLPVLAIAAETGKPLAGIVVGVAPEQWGADRPASISAVTDVDGRAHLMGLLPTTYRVFGWGSTEATRTAKSVVVTTGPNPEVTLRLDATARIHGKVMQDGKPISGVEVQAARKSPTARSSSARSQTDGRFELARVPLGEVSFIAWPYRIISPASLRVTAARDYEVTLEVAKLGSIQGRVTHRGDPVAGADVCCARDVRGTDGRVTTDADGHYEFRGIAPGTYQISAQTHDAFVWPAKVTLGASEDRLLDLELDLSATITGTVVDQEGAPAQGVYVRWRHEQTLDRGDCITDDRGHYRCAAMTGGGRYVAAVYPTAGRQKPFATADGLAYPKVDLRDGASSADNVTIAISFHRLTISGHVVDDTGTPIADARITAIPADDGSAPLFNPWVSLPLTFSAEEGAFKLDGLVNGTYALQAQVPLGGSGISRAVAGASDVTITVMRPAAIEGSLVGFTAAPVVYARPLGNSAKLFSGQVDGNSFRIVGLDPGRYLVDAQNLNEGAAQVVDLHTGDHATITLASKGKAAIDGNVLDFRTQKPLAGATCWPVVSIDGLQGVTNWDTASAPTSDDSGRITLDPAPAGSVDVTCLMASYRWSQPAAHVDVAPGTRSTATLYSVELTQDAPGLFGIQFDWTVTPPRVWRVVAGSPAASAGFWVGDLVTAIDGVSVDGVNGLGVANLIASHPVGASISVTILRAAERKTITATIGAPDPN